MPGYWKRSSKYGNKKVEYRGHVFDSIAERDCYIFFELAAQSGELQLMGLQPKIYLTEAKILYKPDFYYFDNKLRQYVYVDAKGFRTATFNLKARLWKYYGPGILTLCSGYGLNIKVIETIIPMRKLK